MHKILISIPHWSYHIPKELDWNIFITDFDIKTHSDIYTEEIYNLKNVPIVKANAARLLIDPNRFHKNEVLDCFSRDWIFSIFSPTGEAIFKKFPTAQEAEELLEKYYFSYHNEMAEKIQKNDIKFIIDWHSMWSKWPSALRDAWVDRADIMLWNRNYKTCSNNQTEYIKKFFESIWLSVSINYPYIWRAVLETHCWKKDPAWIQIEINRKLYINEETLEKTHSEITFFNRVMQDLIEKIAKDDLFMK